MNVRKIELYGIKGKLIKYLEEGNRIVCTERDAKLIGNAVSIIIDDNAVPDVDLAYVTRSAKEGHHTVHNRLTYPNKVGFYGIRPR